VVGNNVTEPRAIEFVVEAIGSLVASTDGVSAKVLFLVVSGVVSEKLLPEYSNTSVYTNDS